LARIRGAHELAQFLDGAFRFENHENDGTFGHESHKVSKKRPLFVDIVESLSLRLAEVHHFCRANLKSFFDQSIDDETGVPGLYRVWLQYRKSSLHCSSVGYRSAACMASPMSAGLFTT